MRYLRFYSWSLDSFFDRRPGPVGHGIIGNSDDDRVLCYGFFLESLGWFCDQLIRLSKLNAQNNDSCALFSDQDWIIWANLLSILILPMSSSWDCNDIDGPSHYYQYHHPEYQPLYVIFSYFSIQCAVMMDFSYGWALLVSIPVTTSILKEEDCHFEIRLLNYWVDFWWGNENLRYGCRVYVFTWRIIYFSRLSACGFVCQFLEILVVTLTIFFVTIFSYVLMLLSSE